MRKSLQQSIPIFNSRMKCEIVVTEKPHRSCIWYDNNNVYIVYFSAQSARGPLYENSCLCLTFVWNIVCELGNSNIVTLDYFILFVKFSCIYNNSDPNSSKRIYD